MTDSLAEAERFSSYDTFRIVRTAFSFRSRKFNTTTVSRCHRQEATIKRANLIYAALRKCVQIQLAINICDSHFKWTNTVNRLLKKGIHKDRGNNKIKEHLDFRRTAFIEHYKK